MYGIRHGLEMSSTVGSMPILSDWYVFVKYCFTTPFSMIGASFVATPSVSYSLEPFFPGVRARSIRVMPSWKTFVSLESSRKDIFCWIEAEFSAVRRGDTSLEATEVSTTIRYLPLRLFLGPICFTALSSAIIPQFSKSVSAAIGVACHQYPLYLLPSLS